MSTENTNKAELRYLEFLNKKKRYPTVTELVKMGVPKTVIDRHFGGISKLTEYMKKKFPKKFTEIFTSSDFTPAKLKGAKESLRDVTEFIICTAVSGKSVHKDALESLKTWQKHTGGLPIFQPIADLAANRNRDTKGKVVTFFDPALKHFDFVWTDVNLNRKVKLSKILLSAKQLIPHSGLERMVDNESLTIIASPKRMLTPLANMGKFPGYIISGGAITVNNYKSDLYMSSRTAELAKADHKLGGVFVRIIGQNKFEFNLIEFDTTDGHFTLEGKQYCADGKIVEVHPYLITFGDLHIEELTDELFNTSIEILEEKSPTELDLHDVFSGIRCSPFNKRRPELQFLEMKEYKLDTVEASLKDVAYVLNAYAERVKIVNVIDSNHHAFLEYWITSGAYRQGDPRDIRFAHRLAAEWTIRPNLPILQLALELLDDIKLEKNIKFHKSYMSLKYAGIERASHGDKGVGGKKNPSFRKLGYALGGRAITAHTHKSQIIGEMWSVATFSGVGDDRAAYAKNGPSDWAQAYIETYDDGQRNLVHLL